MHTLHFQPPDFERYGALKLAYQVAEAWNFRSGVKRGKRVADCQPLSTAKFRSGALVRVVELNISGIKFRRSPTLDDLCFRADQSGLAWRRKV